MSCALHSMNSSYYNDSDWHVENDECAEQHAMSEDDNTGEECRPKIYSRQSGYVQYKI